MANKKKKGFSLVEVAISLAIIVIVTVTALTIVLNSITPQINNNNRAHAQNFAHNVLQCFQEGNSNADTLALLAFAYEINEQNMGESAVDNEGYTTYTYTSAEHNYTATIKMRFPENDRPDMTITVVDHKGKEIIQFDYTKGDGV